MCPSADVFVVGFIPDWKKKFARLVGYGSKVV